MSNSSVSNVAWERSFKNRTTFSAWNCPAHVANFCNLKDKTKRTFRIDFTAFPDQWVTETLSISSGREVLFKKDLQEFVQELATLSPDSSMVLTVLDVDPQDGQPRAPDTSYVTSIRARKGQARFRADLDREWDNSCAISGIQIRKMLRASHIVPWREASDHERLDPFNGILLSVHYDALFDAGLISFDDGGEILISDEITPHQNKLGLNATLRLEKTHPKRAAYLARHRAAHGFTQK